MRKFLFPLILFLAFSLRFFDLGSVPVGFHRDEAFFGYNAYSLLLTGRDLSSNFFPLHLASFLHSPAGYSYVSIPFIFFFGLSEFSIRIVAALFGTLTILIAYWLVKELFMSHEKKHKTIALISSFLLAISPWHINLSRVTTENVVVVLLISLGVLLYLKWVKKEKQWLVILSFFCFGLTFVFYQAPRAFLPLFIPLLLFIFPPKNVKKNVIFPVILFVITIIVPLVLVLSSHTLSERIRMLSIFHFPTTQLILEEEIREDKENPPLLTRVFHNKVINYSQTFFSNYFAHFSYDFLLTDKGLPDRYRVPNMGLIYFFEIPLLLFGIWKLFGLERKKALFLTGWLLLAPVGSALTFDDVPNLQRTLLVFPALSIVSAYGFFAFWQILPKKRFVWLSKFVIIVLVGFGVAYYLHQYYVHQINHRPWFRQEGYKALAEVINQRQANYKKIVMTGVESQPAIFFLFYNKYDPQLIQQILQQHHTADLRNVTLDKYYFAEEPCPLHTTVKIDKTTSLPILSGEKGTLYINGGNCPKLDKRAKVLSEITRNDGTVVFRLYEL